jgi:hypothetical protein
MVTWPLRFPDAEVVQNPDRDSSAAGLRWRGISFVEGHSGQRQRRHHLGCDRVGRGLLAGDLSASAQADVGLRIWPRINPCGLDVAAGRQGEEIQSLESGWPCSGHEKQLPDRTRSVFLPAIRRPGGAGFYCRPLAVELAELLGLVSSVAGRGLWVSRDFDVAYSQKRAIRHFRPGLSIFCGCNFPGERCCIADWNSAAGVKSGRDDGASMVGGLCLRSCALARQTLANWVLKSGAH